ncbi:MAG: hypothetical protein KIT10_12000 [Flavobacteriales bacterium]|nr:hypothetical protein [Flavobacteriales bacterium]
MRWPLVNDLKEGRADILIATPTEAFDGKSFFTPGSIGDLFGAFDGLSGTLSVLMKGLFSIRLPLNLASNIAAMDEAGRKIWLKLIPNPKDYYTIGEWTELFGSFLDALHEDRSVYKGVRGAMREAAMEFDFSISSKDIKMVDRTGKEWSLIDMINTGVENANKNKTPSTHDYLTTTFLMLNLTGVDDEPNKKARFTNTQNDAGHAFFGGHCDYLVSNDVGFIVKSNIVFGMRGIATETMNLQQFLQRMRYLEQISEQSGAALFKALGHGLRHSFLTTSPSVMFPWRTYVDYKVNERYLNHFNRLQAIHEGEQSFLLLERHQNNLSQFDMYSEYQVVVHQLLDLFGLDDDGLGRFNELDIEQLRAKTWKGRWWTLNGATIGVEVNQGTKKFCLLIL